MEVLAGPSAINNVGNILHSKAITGSAILKIANPWRVGIRFPWQVQKTHDSWMPGGRNELQEPSESHIIAHHRLNRFCLLAEERMENGVRASLPVWGLTNKAGWAVPCMDSGDAAAVKPSFTSDVPITWICSRGHWNDDLCSVKMRVSGHLQIVLQPVGPRTSWQSLPCLTPAESLCSTASSDLSLYCHIQCVLCNWAQ